MTTLKLLFCLLVGFGVAYSQQESFVARRAGPTPAASQNRQPQLQLTTSVADQRYTVDKYGVPSLDWTLKLTYTNTGNTPVLLYKKSSLIPRSMVSRSLKAAARKKYEYDLSSSFISVENMRKAGFRDEDPEEAAFLTLKPGESYSLETDYGVYIYEKEKSSEGLRPGNHFLQLIVPTWYYYCDPAPYREKWSSKGFLWFKTMASEPMPFTIAEAAQ